MSSRIEQKERARAARLAAERAAARAAARRRRLSVLAGAVAAAVVVVGLAVVLSQAGTTDKVSATERASLFDQVPQRGEWLGAKDAPVVVEEYADLQCPFCADFAMRDLPAIVRDYVRPGAVQMRLRLLTFLGPDSVEAAKVAAASGLQNRQWDFVESFYANQGEENSGYVTEEFLREVGGVRGLDVDRAFGDRGDPQTAEQLRESKLAAHDAGVESTPTFRVGRRGGEMKTVTGDQLPAAIDAALGT
jgi:protein-disulfide isomerase